MFEHIILNRHELEDHLYTCTYVSFVNICDLGGCLCSFVWFHLLFVGVHHMLDDLKVEQSHYEIDRKRTLNTHFNIA
jgi:hypothetical protein